MIIRQAKVYSADHKFRMGDIQITDGRISGTSERIAASDGEEIIEADGLYAIPGLVDIHEHGAMGCDFCDADHKAFDTILEYEARHGVLAVCATTMTLPEEDLGKVADAVADYETASGADIVGINLEGPFVNGEKLGAQNPDYLALPDAAMVRRINERAKGKVRLLDLAPELEGAMACIAELKEEMVLSIAHTTCSYQTAMEALAAGASHVTHLYNAMPSLHHREPGPIAAGAEAKAYAELICDGVHIHPAMVRLAFALYGAERIAMISDSMRACGLEDGIYDLGGQEVRVSGSRAELVRDANTIAGGVTSLFDCMKTAVQTMGIPLEMAVRAASENPAQSIGVEKDYGSIAPGRYGNIILCDEELAIQTIIKKGKVIVAKG